ncbi:MAG: PKD domain-containing protein, partial [Calditrichaeota bacterium]
TNPSQSIVIGTDKAGDGIYVWNMDGQQIQHITLVDYPNNGDVRYGMDVGGEQIDIYVVGVESDSRVEVFNIDPNTSRLTNITTPGGILLPQVKDPYGVALYKRASDGEIFVFVTSDGGQIGVLNQYRLFDDGSGKVMGEHVRSFGGDVNGQDSEGIVVDDQLGYVYVAAENCCVHKFYADPNMGSSQLATFAHGDGIDADREGMALYGCSDGTGYIQLSSQGNERIKVYRREGDGGNPHSHSLVTTIYTPDIRGTDGIDVTNRPAGPNFPYGFVVKHNSYGRSFGLIPWENIAQTYLTICPEGGSTCDVTANFTTNANSGCGSLTVNFSDISTGPVTSWEWHFGDGTTSTEQNPMHSYTLPGNYTVELTVFSESCSDKEIKSNYITVGEIPVADFSAAPVSGDAPLQVNFTDESSGSPTSWFWNFGDGNTSTEQNPTHTYTNSGVYSIALSVTNDCDSDDITKSDYVTVTVPPVNQHPVPVITSPGIGANYPSGQSISFTGDATDYEDGTVPASRFTWRASGPGIPSGYILASGTKSGTTPVPPGTGTYTISLQVNDSEGLSATTSVSFTVGGTVTPPAAPSNLVATVQSASQINLAWTDNATNETGFRIERKTGSGGTYSEIATVGANVTTYASSGLAAGTTYFYRVRAYNGDGNSAYSNEANATTPGNPPAAPSNLVATAQSASQINLSWTDNANNETGFRIERKTGSGGTYSEIATVGTNVTSYTSSGLSAGTTYFYRIRAYNGDGNSAYSNEANATTPGNPPAAPSNLVATAQSASQINLAWTDNATNETGFRIERKTGSGGTYSEIATVGTNVTSYASSGLSAGTTYFYRVRAYNGDGNSAYSNEANATTQNPPNTPPIPTIAQPADGAIFTVGQNVSFFGDATDAEDGLVAASGFSWRVLTPIGTTEQLATNTKSSSGVPPIAGNYTLILEVTDSGGLQATDQVTITAVSGRFSGKIGEPGQGWIQLEAQAATQVPDGYAFYDAYPNPFNPETVLSFSLPQAEKVTLRIYDALGRDVKVLCDAMSHDPGTYSYRWNGRSNDGRFMPSGIYYARIDAGVMHAMRKLILLK